VHLANVHAALYAAPFAAPAAGGAVERARAMRSRFVVDAFNAQSGSEPPVAVADLAREPAHHTLRVRLVSGALDREHVACVVVAPRVPSLEAVCQQLRLALNHRELWTGCPEGAATLLAPVCRDEKAFATGWDVIEGEGGDTQFRAFGDGAVKIFVCEAPVTHSATEHDEEALALTRAAATVSHTLTTLGIAPRRAVVCVTAPKGEVTLQVESFPSVPDGKFVHELSADRYAPGAAPPDARGGGAVLAVACTGIQHDAIFDYPRGVAKAAVALRVASPVHPVFGLHDTAAVAIAVPQLLRAAHRVGEIHFMTQIAKAILRARPEKDSEVAALTAEQRGAHLKDEVKLCTYWNAVQAALTPRERRVLDLGITRMQERQPITYEALEGRVASDAAPALDTPGAPCRSLHHVEARVRIKGALAVPCASLGVDTKSLNVRIDNVWTLESHLLAAK
jgi:hypothetical protein